MQRKRFLIIFAMMVCAAVLSGCVVVDDGMLGVSKSFGKIQDKPLKPGPYWHIPIAREVALWDVKTQRRSRRLSIPSAEGLIVKLETAVLFRPVEVVRLRKEVGMDYVSRLLDTTLENAFREVIGKEKVEAIITNQEKFTSMVFAQLKETLNKRGVMIENLMITGLELPQTFKDAIERKLSQEQKALQKTFELDQAKKDAEIEVARARGVAEAQEIVRATLSSKYLQYLWISTLNENPNVIYVATEANMPLFRTTGEPARKQVK